jgi:hypothetical protein
MQPASAVAVDAPWSCAAGQPGAYRRAEVGAADFRAHLPSTRSLAPCGNVQDALTGATQDCRYALQPAPRETRQLRAQAKRTLGALVVELLRWERADQTHTNASGATCATSPNSCDHQRRDWGASAAPASTERAARRPQSALPTMSPLADGQ